MRREKENFARFLPRVRHELGLAILWVEPDMQMVAVCTENPIRIDEALESPKLTQ